MSTSRQKFDVYLSFRGEDTGRNFISYFYRELDRSNIRTFKNDKEWESISAMEESSFAIVVLSVSYTASPWCLEELVMIMDLEKLGSIEVIPIFYGVEPSHVRWQIGVTAEHFEKHEGGQDPKKVRSWRKALTNLASISGYSSYHWEDDSEMIGEITDKISKRVAFAKPKRSGSSKLVEIDTHMKAIHQFLDLNSNKNVKVIGIWARGGNDTSAFSKFVYENISQHFESHCFLENVKRISHHRHMSDLRLEFHGSVKRIYQDRDKESLERVKRISQDRHKEFLESVKKISQDRHMSHLHKEFLIWIQRQSWSESRLKNEKVLLVADDVSKSSLKDLKVLLVADDVSTSSLKNEKVLLVADDVSKSSLKDLKVLLVADDVSTSSLKNEKVLLVANDVDTLEQLDSLAEYFNKFGPGSRVIITTQDKQLLISYGITLVYELGLLYIPDSS